MSNPFRSLCFGLAACVAFLPLQAWAQAPAPAAPPMTLWRFLGIPQAASKVNAQLFNRRGNMPRLESRPPLKPIADPSNLDPKMPKAIQAAAEIKQAEDLAPQKRKAIKYLASIGCACYDKDGKVTEALVDSMDDCTEMVRLNTVEAIKTAAEDVPCDQCGNKCCCNMEILEKLAELAYERGPDGCYVEPSERVRQAAVEALMVCCTTQEPIEILDEEPAPPGPIEPPPANGEAGDPAPLPPGTGTVTSRRDGDFSLSAFINLGTGNPSGATSLARSTPSVQARSGGAVVDSITDSMPRRGEVTFVNAQEGIARVKFGAAGKVPERTILRAYHKFLFQTAQIGDYEVIGWNQGEAVIRKADRGGLGRLSRGDTVVVK